MRCRVAQHSDLLRGPIEGRQPAQRQEGAMSILTSTRPDHFHGLPHRLTDSTPPVRRVPSPEPEPDSGPADGPLLGALADVTELAGQANQTTTFATWAVAT